MNIKVMSYNIFSGRTPGGSYDLEGKIAAIRAFFPDFAGLCEVHSNTRHSAFTKQTETFAKALGYPYFYFARAIDHDGGHYGIALLSRHPLSDCETVPVPDVPPENRKPHFESRVHLSATADVRGEKIKILVSHYGLSEEEQRNAVSETLRLSDTEMPVIFMGDLNSTPDSDVLKPIFARFSDTGSCTSLCSFPSDKPDRRIDYIFASRHFTVKSFDIPFCTASDHRSVTAEVIKN